MLLIIVVKSLGYFFPNKSLGQLLDIPQNNFIFLKTFGSELSYTEV